MVSSVRLPEETKQTRRMVDAVREILGMDPLYCLGEPEAPQHRNRRKAHEDQTAQQSCPSSP